MTACERKRLQGKTFSSLAATWYKIMSPIVLLAHNVIIRRQPVSPVAAKAFPALLLLTHPCSVSDILEVLQRASALKENDSWYKIDSVKTLTIGKLLICIIFSHDGCQCIRGQQVGQASPWLMLVCFSPLLFKLQLSLTKMLSNHVEIFAKSGKESFLIWTTEPRLVSLFYLH